MLTEEGEAEKAEPETESEMLTEEREAEEAEPETESETLTEEGEAEEAEPETESEMLTEEGEIAEGEETDPETESEMLTEKETMEEIPEKRQIRVFHIEVKLPEGGRIYDGTDRIELSYDTEGLEQEADGNLQYQAWMTGIDAGEWPVEYRFWLTGEMAQEVSLQVEQKNLTVQVLPKPLKVTIPDGWKTYGDPSDMEKIHLSGELEVTGFIKDENGQEQIPEGFEPPEITVDSSVVGQWSEIYEKGSQKVYNNALIMKNTGEGKTSGNPTRNYSFPETARDENYKKGKLVIAQNQVEEGKDYEIRGEDGAWFRGNVQNFWIRKGTSLQVLPLKERGYSEGWSSGALFQGGTYSFSMKKKNRDGEITAVSQEQQICVRVDGEVPPADLEISGACENGDSYYGKDDVFVRIGVPEDPESGSRQARYFIAASREALPVQIPEKKEWWQDCGGGMQLQLANPGSYVIYVETEDNVGNRAYAKSPAIVIDRDKPEIEITGAKDHSANAGEVCLTVSCRDPSYRSGSLNVSIEGANGTFVPAGEERKADAQGEVLCFADFEHTKSTDDIYTVTAAAEDLAGNRSEETITFSVNRFGSVYDLSPDTKEELEQYYHKKAFPVTFLETNIDYVGSVQILCRREGVLSELKEKQDYSVSCSGSETGWKQYTYTIREETFQKEGNYEVLLLSQDRARNSSDSQTQKKAVKFIIDHSAPECLITGLEANGVYHAESMWICLEPRDNICLKEMNIYLDGRKAAGYSRKEIQQLGGAVKWRVNAGKQWQCLEVQVSDAAGNQMWTGEIPFYITESTDTEKIPPYKKNGKSAREQAEMLLQKRTERTETENDAEKTVLSDAGNGKESRVNRTERTDDGKQRTMNGYLQAVFQRTTDRKLLFLLPCVLAVIFILLTAGIHRLRQRG